MSLRLRYLNRDLSEGGMRKALQGEGRKYKGPEAAAFSQCGTAWPGEQRRLEVRLTDSRG